ncbi:Kinesin-like protein [Fulvia fulva]|uniref:Kinesin-like protein n=1 Tax=Passalora fulva TaxID=5499 RepID=A0A9Q8LD10_PASFU|nr:Kinesin-like protein [Fulvia fulva]KAK4630951.1 Kinesin-like protein [Fulvia fulva]KAK4632783.1 Kinesin-like protein [Fulvia fulva]UJO14468.1 Kinesin-like protein [Fulvia fulva]WPV10544.1 Kinesin-like protein [Fulvia fulva]WPV26895.1 Kinesin-like protein [Fulvia fulva]
MFIALRERRAEEFDQLCATFASYLSTNMAARASTASAPSLRSKTPVDMERPFTPPDGDGGNVKVVVRVRKFIKRELEKQSPCIIHMSPATQETTIQPPEVTADSRRVLEEKKFTFDKSFWSHNETDAHFAGQRDIYASFGEEFLDHNFDGYHTCIFAYGQTGSGKSYTMMGSLDQPGLIPRTCRGLFERIEAEQNGSITYNVHVSYFEIYNEHVKDLLTPRTNPPTYLKIRESKSDGVYVQNLTDEPVKSYEDIERLMKTGDLNRTTAMTKMNDTSSRSHAVFTLTLKQIQHDLATDSTIERVARMRLVDLAGSERAGRTEATGQRLREGGNINQSLTTLGRVIAALADPKRQKATRVTGLQNQTKRRAEVVPYRDSVLTWLLKDSLGGNSKTAMVACISPTDYEETLSTLRYADQAKRIRTKAHVNQDAVSAAERDAKIMEMQETIKQLQLSVNASATRKRDEADRTQAELEDYQRQVSKMQRAMEESRAVSEVKIRALTQEVDELRPQNQALQIEIEALRRHLALAVGELKNPIVLPEGFSEEDEDRSSIEGSEDGDRDSGMGDDNSDFENEHGDWQADVDELLKDLGLFKRKVADDKMRFPHPETVQ